jgi:PHD finger protein
MLLLTLLSRFIGDDDEGAGEFFVQCEMCNVWQHGQCMGIRNEDAVKADHYYCEKCRPDLHVELLKYAAPTPTSLCPLTTISNRLGDSLSGLGTVIHPQTRIPMQRPRTASLARILRPIKSLRNGEIP